MTNTEFKKWADEASEKWFYENETIGYDEDGTPIPRFMNDVAYDAMGRMYQESLLYSSYWRLFWRFFGWYREDLNNLKKAYFSVNVFIEHGRISDEMRSKLKQSLKLVEPWIWDSGEHTTG